MPLSDNGLLWERRHRVVDGVHRLYRWGNIGASAVNGAMLHAYPFAWEIAVVRFEGRGDAFKLCYDSGLTDDVEVFQTDDDAQAFLDRIAALAKAEKGA